MSRPRSGACLAAVLLAVLSVSAYAAPPTPSKTARAALDAWKAAVRTAEPEPVLALIPEGASILFRSVGGPGPERALDRAGLQAALARGEWNALGLDRHLLLPRARDLKKDGKDRMRAADPRCPEVTWVFARADGAWRLVEVIRTWLAC